jgi:hypothetical protein
MTHGGGHVGGGHPGGGHHNAVQHSPDGQPGLVPARSGRPRSTLARLIFGLLFGIAVVLLVVALSR